MTLTDRTWTALTGDRWRRRDGSDDRIVDDATAPGARMVLEYVYPAGFLGGTAPATHYYPLEKLTEIFVGLQWKVSSPWQGHATGVNKLQFLYTGSSDITMVMYGPPGGPYELRVMPEWPQHDGSWLVPNVNRVPLTPGQWHRVEWHLKYGTASGIVRWWQDGLLVGDYKTVHFPDDAGFLEYQMSPTWGGVGDVKTETDYYRFDESYLSGPSLPIRTGSTVTSGSRLVAWTRRYRPATKTDAAERASARHNFPQSPSR